MSYLIFSIMPMFICLFWVVLLLIDRQHINLSKRFLAFFLSLAFVNYFTHALYFNHQYELYSLFDSIWCFTSLAVFPLYYYYIRLLTKDVKINYRWAWILISSFLLSAFSSCLYFLMSPEEKDIFIQGIMYHKEGFLTTDSVLVELQILRLQIFKIIFIIQVVFALYFGLKLIREYNIEIRRFYSNIGGKDLNPIEWLLLFFVFACVISVVSSIIGKDYFMVHPLFLIIPSFTHSLFLFGVGYFGYKQNFTIEEFKKDIAIAKAESKLYSEKQITNVKNEILNNEELQKKLFQLLEEDKIYRQPELRITDVANLLNTNRTYISKIINDELHTNFSDLINEYRIESAKNQLLDCTKNALSLTEIAENSGFSTNSSFYRVFKNKVGVSPGDFRKKGCDSTLMQFKGMIK